MRLLQQIKQLMQTLNPIFRVRPSRLDILPGKSVHLSIEKPVLDEYNKISLDKNTKYVRIKHKSTTHKNLIYPPARRQSSSSYSSSKGSIQSNHEWEKTIDKYMKSKEVIKSRKKDNLQFGFHQLDKGHRVRYIKQMYEEKLPPSIVNLAKRRQNLSSHTEQISQSFSLKPEKSVKQTQVLNPLKISHFRRQSQLNYSERWRNVRTYTDVQEKIMTNFISNYFKSKHRQTKREEQTFVSNSLERHNTN